MYYFFLFYVLYCSYCGSKYFSKAEKSYFFITVINPINKSRELNFLS